MKHSTDENEKKDNCRFSIQRGEAKPMAELEAFLREVEDDPASAAAVNAKPPENIVKLLRCLSSAIALPSTSVGGD